MSWDRKKRGASTGYYYKSVRVPDKPHPVSVIELPAAGRVVVAELFDLERPWKDDQQQTLEHQLAQQIMMNRAQRILADYFRFEAVKRRLDYQAGDLEQEVKIAYDQLMPPAPVLSMATDPYRGVPLDERVDEDEAKRLMKQAQDHHFSKEFTEARTIYQDIVARFPGSKQAVTADQQIKNLQGL